MISVETSGVWGVAAKARVYSYLRFSDPKQAAGGSVDRHLEYAARWAADNEMELDASLSLRDEGLLAYHQRLVRQGALGVFLRAVEDGQVPDGSVLVVEGLDRLSRAEPLQAQAKLAQIVNAGITVVTASDGREYNRERLKAQPMDGDRQRRSRRRFPDPCAPGSFRAHRDDGYCEPLLRRRATARVDRTAGVPGP